MPPEKFQRPLPRERTFAEVFPWRNIRRALMLVLLIVAIVVIKRSTRPMLAHVGEMWGAPLPPRSPSPSTPVERPSSNAVPEGADGPRRQIRLGPGLSPRPEVPTARPPAAPSSLPSSTPASHSQP